MTDNDDRGVTGCSLILDGTFSPHTSSFSENIIAFCDSPCVRALINNKSGPAEMNL